VLFVVVLIANSVWLFYARCRSLSIGRRGRPQLVKAKSGNEPDKTADEGRPTLGPLWHIQKRHTTNVSAA